MLTVVHDSDAANADEGGAGRSLLDEIVRDGARQMLAAALQAEVAAYVRHIAILCRIPAYDPGFYSQAQTLLGPYHTSWGT